MSAGKKTCYITPPNYLKQKVGGGGLPKHILDKGDLIIANNNIDFTPQADALITLIETTIADVLNSQFRTHDHVTSAIYPVMQLKAHGGMFGKPLVSEIAASALLFLENIYLLDDDAIDVLKAHQKALKPAMSNSIVGLGGAAGQALVSELQQLCERYYTKHEIEPEN